MGSQKRVVCFDLWNTLIRSLDPTGASYEQILISAGVQQAEIYPIVRERLMNKDLSYAQMAKILTTHFQIKDQQIAQLVVQSWQQDNTKAQWFDGAKELVQSVADSDTVVLVSNITGPGWRSINQKLRIEELFAKTILSFEQGFSKPYPRIWKMVEELFPKANEYWMTGDNETDDIAVPRSRGWKTILVNKDGTDLAKVRSRLLRRKNR